MKLSSKKTIESKLPEYAGVKFTLNKMTEARRIALSSEHSEPMAEYRALQGEINDILQGVPKDDKDFKFDTPTNVKLWNLISKRDLIGDSKINPAWVKYGLKSIEGLETEDGVQVTAETFLEFAPPDLFQEVLAAIHSEAGLSAEQTKN